MAMFDIEKHPAFLAAPAVIALMKPLLKLGITDFAVAMVCNNQSYLLSSSQLWLARYFDQEYYKLGLFSNDDLRASKKEVFLVWDNLEGTAAFQKFYKDSYEHGLAHFFTITQWVKNKQYTFYFTADPNSKSINQLYYNKMNELLAFIAFFREKIASDKVLMDAFSTKVLDLSLISKNSNNHIKLPKHCLVDSARETTLITRYMLSGPYGSSYLSLRELQCLYWLRQGKTIPEIAILLCRSQRTIEERVMKIKAKLQCDNLFQLGNRVAELGLHHLLKQQVMGEKLSS